MQAVIDFFVGITDIITSLIDFVISFVSDLVYVIQLTSAFVIKIPMIFSFMPNEALSILVLIFGVVVIYKVLGREG